jgi:hypothetical protein
MKSVERWSPKLKAGKQPGKDDIVECKEQVPLSRFAAMVAIGVLILIGTGAILAISGTRPKKIATGKTDVTELNAQHIHQNAVVAESKPANLYPPERVTSEPVFSPPTQDLAIKGLPGSPYQPPPTRKRARDRKFQHQFFVFAQKSSSGPNSKMHWPKAFIMYLEAHQEYLRAILKHSATAAPNPK